MFNDFISDDEFFELLSYYDFEFEEGNGEVFIEETNQTVKIEEFLDELIPKLQIKRQEKDEFDVCFSSNNKNMPYFFKEFTKFNSLNNELEIEYNKKSNFSSNVQKKYLSCSNNKIYNSKQSKEFVCAS